MKASKENGQAEIRLSNCQIKSIEIARTVAQHLAVLESIVGIRETRITLVDCFICPDITVEQVKSLEETPMEMTLRSIIQEIRRRV